MTVAARTEAILERLLAGHRPAPDEAAALVAGADLLSLGLVARERTRPWDPVTFITDRTVILGNVCDPGCPWCAGAAVPGAREGWEASRERVLRLAAAAVARGARQLVLQGGHRRDRPLGEQVALLRALKAAHPELELVAFSPSEVLTWSRAAGLAPAEVLARLQEAGLGAMLAAGGEALPARIPEHRRLLAGPWPEWEAVIAACGERGIPVIAPVPFGLGESPEDRARFLLRLRDLQDRTGAIALLVPLAPAVAPPMPGEGDELRVVEAGAAAGAPPPAQLMATGYDYLRMVALTRLLVPNVERVSASPLTQGAKVAQVALDCGANDLGGTHFQYELAELAAGRVGPMTAPELARLIRDAGRVPAWRDAGARRITPYTDGEP